MRRNRSKILSELKAVQGSGERLRRVAAELSQRYGLPESVASRAALGKISLTDALFECYGLPTYLGHGVAQGKVLLKYALQRKEEADQLIQHGFSEGLAYRVVRGKMPLKDALARYHVLPKYLALRVARGEVSLEDALQKKKEAERLTQQHGMPQGLAHKVVRGEIPLAEALQGKKLADPADQARKKQVEQLTQRYGLTESLALSVAQGEILLKDALQRKRDTKQQRKPDAKPRNLPAPKQGHEQPLSGGQERSVSPQYTPLTLQPTQEQTPRQEEVLARNLEQLAEPDRHRGNTLFIPTYDVLTAIKRRKDREDAAFLSQEDNQTRLDEEARDEQEPAFLEQTEAENSWGTPPDAEPVFTQEKTLDELAPSGTLQDRLHRLNMLMSDVAPERVRSVVSQTIRRDTQLVKALKEFYQFCCQFPECGVKIPKRGGGFYIEVAHIEPVHKGGRSILGNLLVLCPNHHKEFDNGELEIHEQTEDGIRGRLNGREFTIQQLKRSRIV